MIIGTHLTIYTAIHCELWIHSGSSSTYYTRQKDKREIKSPLSSFQKVNKSGLLAKMIFVGAGNPMPLYSFGLCRTLFKKETYYFQNVWCLLLVTRERGMEEAICSFKKQPVLFPDVLHGRRIWCHWKGLMTMYQKHSANIALWYLHCWSEEAVLTRLRCWQKSFFSDRKK